MSDFLTRLAQRAVGVAPLVQPLIRPAFAPPAVPTADAEAPAAAPTPHRSRTSGHAADAVRPGVSVHEPVGPGAVAPLIAHAVAHPAAVVSPTTIMVERRRRELRPTAVSDPAENSAVVGRRAEEPGDAAAEEMVSRAEPTASPATAARAPVDVLVPARPALGDVTREAVREHRGESGGAEQAPTIRVTIGRIEVRAVTPPAPPPARPSRAIPTLSLTDYLRAQHRKTPP